MLGCSRAGSSDSGQSIDLSDLLLDGSIDRLVEFRLELRLVRIKLLLQLAVELRRFRRFCFFLGGLILPPRPNSLVGALAAIPDGILERREQRFVLATL